MHGDSRQSWLDTVLATVGINVVVDGVTEGAVGRDDGDVGGVVVGDGVADGVLAGDGGDVGEVGGCSGEGAGVGDDGAAGERPDVVVTVGGQGVGDRDVGEVDGSGVGDRDGEGGGSAGHHILSVGGLLNINRRCSGVAVSEVGGEVGFPGGEGDGLGVVGGGEDPSGGDGGLVGVDLVVTGSESREGVVAVGVGDVRS